MLGKIINQTDWPDMIVVMTSSTSFFRSDAVAGLLLVLLSWLAWLYGRGLVKWLVQAAQCTWSTADKPCVVHKPDSMFCERVVEKCSALQEQYVPPLIWGRCGHIQTLLFGTISRFNVPPISGQRHTLVVRDGSTLHYDVYTPPGCHDDVTMLVCPGIGNSSESKYVKSFVSHAMDHGYRVVVFNHLGALKNEKLTGTRIFTYGGTGDLSAVFDHTSKLHPHTRYVGVGFSLGACVLMRFLGEDPQRRRKFVCATSVCQGYDPSIAMGYMHNWTNFRCFYNLGIARKQLALIRRHSDALLTVSLTNDSRTSLQPHSKPTNQNAYNHHSKPTNQNADNHHSKPTNHNADDHRSKRTNQNTDEIDSLLYPHIHRCHGSHDHNGMALNTGMISGPDVHGLRRVTSVLQLDELYTRRVCGFTSVQDMYRWTSCVELMYKITELPILIVNSRDDPLVAVDSNVLDIPRRYVQHNPKAMLVIPKHGGHLGFFEGGVWTPHSTSWIDRLLVQFTRACHS